MSILTSFIKNVKEFYSEINAATLTGAIDVLVIEQEDGSYLSSPFHVRFGKLGVLKSKEKIVDLEINGEPVNIFMKLEDTGAAYFVEEVDQDDKDEDFVATSPIPDQPPFWPDRRRGELTPLQLDTRFQDDDHGTPMLESVPTYVSCGAQTDTPTTTPESEEVEAEPGLESRKGKLNKRKRHARNKRKKHSRNASKTSMKDIVEQSELFHMDDVNDADQEDQEEEDDQDSEDQWPNQEQDHHHQLVPGPGNSTPTTVDETRRLSLLFAESFNYELEAEASVSSITPNTDSIIDEVDIHNNNTLTENHNIVHEIVDNIMDDSLIGSRIPGMHRCTSETDALNAIMVGSPDSTGSLGYVDDNLEFRSQSVAPGFHYFSDTELGGNSPMASRPGSPVHSDGELEKSNKEEASAWRWGELPSPVSARPPVVQVMENETSPKEAAEERLERKRTMWSWLSGKRTSREERAPETPNITLDDLYPQEGEVNKELAAIYLQTRSQSSQGQSEETPDPLSLDQYDHIPRAIDIGPRDEDAESGTGPSLPMSPHSVQGAIGGPRAPTCETFSPADDYGQLLSRHMPDLALSMCGPIVNGSPLSPELFAEHQLSPGDFVERLKCDSLALSSPSLVVRLQERYMTWDMAGPILLSLLVFKQQLPDYLTENLVKESLSVNMSKTPEDLAKEKEENELKEEQKTGGWLSWWRKSDAPGDVKEEHDGDAALLPPVEEALRTDVATQTDLGWPISLRKKRTEQEVSTGSSENDSDEHIDERREKKYKKTVRLSSDKIKELNLKQGSNEVQFSVTTAFQGTTRCKCHIFLWHHTSKIVISDIDGTITKSDVLGHILPVIGKDWAQSGVAGLFTKIRNNGYHIMYLSARAIGQASVTKEYLQSVKQGDLCLPDGPLFLNPESLIHAFRRETIDRNPEEFKIRCLKDVQSLFGRKNPFFAGYGNRSNDAYAYRAVGIPISRIFTINPAGELRHELTQSFQTSYNNQSAMVDHVFPSINKPGFDPNFNHLEYSSFSYWRQPLTDVDSDDMNKLLEK